MHERHPDNLEALQYLEALCRDLGRSSDEFTQRLDRLRRSLGQRAVAMHTSMPTQLGTVDTKRSGASVTEKIRMTYDDDEEETKQDHRSLLTRSARPGKVLTEQIEATPNIRPQTLSSVRPMSPPRTAAGGRNVRKPAEDDDFGDTDVSSLLV